MNKLEEKYGKMYENRGLLDDWHPDWDNCYEDEDGNLICGHCGGKLVQPVPVFLAQIMHENADRKVSHVCFCYEELKNKHLAKEKAEKKRQKIEALKKESLLSSKYSNSSFDDFDMEVDPTIQNAKMRAEKYCNHAKACLDNAYGILFYSKGKGLGKTEIMACMANVLTSKLYTVYFTSLADLLSKKRSNEFTEEEMLEKVTSCDFLFLDDLGTEGATSDWASSMVYNIINARYNAHKPVICSSNANYTELLSMGMKSQAVDRLSEMCTVRLTLTGESYRAKERKRKEAVVPF